MEAKIFETHAHYEDKKFDPDREQLLAGMQENGIEYVVNVGSSLATTKATLELIQKYDFMFGAVGVHPEETGELDEESFAWLTKVTSADKVVAVGEIGLDYYWDQPERSIQKQWFERQIFLAKEVKLPMIIHSRDAAQDTYEIIKACQGEEAGGVIHCFSYGTQMAKQFLEMGFYLGIGGVVTFKNAKKLKEVVQYAPLDQLVLETDCPYMAPEPHRGKRNSSLYLCHVAEQIAALKGISPEEVIRVTNENGKKLYRIGER